MELLWIALLIQMIFFISQDLHYLVIGFIACSLMISFVDIRPLVFVGIPMILCQMWYIYRVESIEEGFKRRRKRRGKRRGIKKKQWKKAGRFINKNKKYGLLALGPAGVATFAALEANEARKKKRRRQRRKKKSTFSKSSVANDSHMEEHSRIKKEQDDLAKTNSQLRTTISNIHNISK